MLQSLWTSVRTAVSNAPLQIPTVRNDAVMHGDLHCQYRPVRWPTHARSLANGCVTCQKLNAGRTSPYISQNSHLVLMHSKPTRAYLSTINLAKPPHTLQKMRHMQLIGYTVIVIESRTGSDHVMHMPVNLQDITRCTFASSYPTHQPFSARQPFVCIRATPGRLC